ncbi:MAG: alcohol dehydrogenase catalytic domain-containing protein [Armatimonadetes bacterium]|nr:alcohol dehydrogenase catalytic domain-containing protein [Armatimonadota bacterium]
MVAVRAVGLCGSDLHYWLDGRIGETRLERPLIMGHEPAGEIVAVGDNVTHVRPGQRVAIDPAVPCGYCEWCAAGHPNLCPHVRFFGSPPTDGALREQLCHPAECLFPLPENLTFTDGALCETLGVAIHAVDLSHLQPGQTAAILGCGPVGLMTLQVARCAGAGPIYVADEVPERLAMAQALGAELAIDVRMVPSERAILDLTDGRGVDAMFDCATSSETPAQCCEGTKIGGRVVLVGIPPENSFTLHHASARRKGLTVKFARRMPAVYPRALHLASRGMVQMDVLATHSFPLDRAPEAFAVAAERRDGVIKAVVEI